MAQRAGVFLTKAGGSKGTFLVSRLQGAGVDSLNIPNERINELGDEQSLGLVYDTPDLSYGLESLDMTTDLEAILTGVDPTTVTTGQEFKFTNAVPIDIVSPWKKKYGTFLATTGIAVPYLVLERAQYRFGVRANSSKQFTVRGDSIYFCQKTPYAQTFTEAGVGPYSFANAAVKTVEQGQDVYAYCVTVYNPDGTTARLVHGTDYTDTTTGFTLSVAPQSGAKIAAVYASATVESDPQSIHPSTTVKPSAIRGRDVTLRVGDGLATPAIFEWKGVQTVEANWQVTLDADEELGNPHYVDRDYDIPDVNGNVALRPATADAFMSKLAQVTGITSTSQTINTGDFINHPVELEILVHAPNSSTVLETIYVPDAMFQPPAPNPRVGQKFDVTLPWSSLSGSMSVFAGARP
jgi:hypothetical protein